MGRVFIVDENDPGVIMANVNAYFKRIGKSLRLAYFAPKTMTRPSVAGEVSFRSGLYCPEIEVVDSGKKILLFLCLKKMSEVENGRPSIENVPGFGYIEQGALICVAKDVLVLVLKNKLFYSSITLTFRKG